MIARPPLQKHSNRCRRLSARFLRVTPLFRDTADAWTDLGDDGVTDLIAGLILADEDDVHLCADARGAIVHILDNAEVP